MGKAMSCLYDWCPKKAPNEKFIHTPLSNGVTITTSESILILAKKFPSGCLDDEKAEIKDKLKAKSKFQ